MITTPAREEVATYYSDFKRNATVVSTSRLTINSGYGSKYDLETFTLDLCDEDLDEIYKFLEKKVKNKLNSYKTIGL